MLTDRHPNVLYVWPAAAGSSFSGTPELCFYIVNRISPIWFGPSPIWFGPSPIWCIIRDGVGAGRWCAWTGVGTGLVCYLHLSPLYTCVFNCIQNDVTSQRLSLSVELKKTGPYYSVSHTIYVTEGVNGMDVTILTSFNETNVHCYLSMEYLRNWWHLVVFSNTVSYCMSCCCGVIFKII